MPYIDDKNRDALNPAGPFLMRAVTPGELNFQISKLCDQYVSSKGGPSYSTYNELIGALECAKLEFYRRLAAPYEDMKLYENGDVYTQGIKS